MRRNASLAALAAVLLCMSPLLPVPAAVVGGAVLAAQVTPLGTPIPNRPLGVAEPDEDGMEIFLRNQLGHERVDAARARTDSALRAGFEASGVDYPAREIFLRAFKHERELEVWARSDPEAEFTLIRTYPVCALAGQLGPKRKMGDIQVPEGFYYIDEFNPRSEFHLSLRVNYPNLADRMRRQALSLGGDIYIHGGCATVGCVPIEDENIEELYWLAVQATDQGQRVIPVHIFPARLDEDGLRWLEDTFQPEADLLAFWRNLADGYEYFERTRRVPWVTVSQSGDYEIPAIPRLAGGEGEEGAEGAAAGDGTTDGPGDDADPRGPLPTGVPAPTDSTGSGGSPPDGPR